MGAETLRKDSSASIARALCWRTGDLVFTTKRRALDAKSERTVQDAIDALIGGAVFVITTASRRSTRAPHRRAFEHGGVSGGGTHEELMESNALYASSSAECVSAPAA